MGVLSMNKGELAKFTLKPDFAYGASGSPPKIPPNSSLVFEVELFDFKVWIFPSSDFLCIFTAFAFF